MIIIAMTKSKIKNVQQKNVKKQFKSYPRKLIIIAISGKIWRP